MSSKNTEKKTIFIVDDDQSILDVLTIILAGEEYSVVPISNKKVLFQKLEKQKPNLILLDLVIAGSSGKEIIEELKSNPKTEKIPVIILSALAEINSIAKSTGADDYLSKPFEIDTLVSKVAKYLV